MTQYFDEKKNKNPVRENQRLGYEIAQKLNDVKHAPIYMRMAKTERVEILEQAMRFVIDYKNCTNPTALFLWKLKELKREHKVISVSNKRSVQIAIDALSNNKVILFPTDTVYCIGCRLYSKDAIQKLYRIKKISAKVSSPILISDKEQIFEIIKDAVDDKTDEYSKIKRLVNMYWPGALTIFVRVGNPKLYPTRVINKEDKTIGVRMPNYEWICNVINELGEPIIATSANIAGDNLPLKLADISNVLIDKVELAFKDQQLKMLGKSSKVLKIVGSEIETLRE